MTSTWNDGAFSNMFRSGGRKILEDYSEKVVSSIKQKMEEGKSGNIYYIKDLGKHQAAADGEAPAVMYGNLIKAIEYKIEDDGLKLVSKIGANVDGDEMGYAYWLETGFRVNGGGIHVKPYLLSTALEVKI